MTRWKAAGMHLMICGVIALTVLIIMLFVWYPEPYFDALGGKRLLMVLLGVDVTLGPLITLIIYNQRKRYLKFDLAVVAFLQISALIYGITVLFNARPVYLVFTVDQFEVVRPKDIKQEEQAKVDDDRFKSLSVFGPKLVTALRPDKDIEEMNRILFSSLNGGPDLQAMPQHYVPYEETTDLVRKKIKSLDDLPDFRSEFREKVIEVARKEGYEPEEVGYLPVRAGNTFLTAIMDKKDADIIKMIAIDPWS